MWQRLDRLEPAAAMLGGMGLAACVWWTVAWIEPEATPLAGMVLAGLAVGLAFSGRPVLHRAGPDVVAAPPWADIQRPPGIERLERYAFSVVTVDKRGQERERHEGEAWSFAEDLGDGVRLEMTHVPGGRFLMGSPKDEADSSDRERPQHAVTLGPFYLGRFTVTQRQWQAVAGWPRVDVAIDQAPSGFKGDDRPVERVSWNDAVEFCRRLSARSGRDYRLPSESQWEYACRAGTTTPFHLGPTITPALVNYDGNYPYGDASKGVYRESTVPVGSLGMANDFGLFDMHGNVWEWCQDAWHGNYRGAPADGRAWEARGDASRRVARGGSWVNLAGSCRSAYRAHDGPGYRNSTVGFRVLCVLSRTP